MPRNLAFLLADPYVKIYMLCNEQRTGTKKKTHVKKKTLNPVFNESFVFDLPQHLEGIDDGEGANSIKNISFEFQLLDWDRVTKNEVRNRRQLRIQIGGGKGTLTYQYQYANHGSWADWEFLPKGVFKSIHILTTIPKVIFDWIFFAQHCLR